MTIATNPASATKYSNYDAWGRVLNSTQTTQGVDYPFTYTYDAAGDLLTEAYPITGRTVTYTYDAIGRPSTVQGYASVSQYAAQGAVQQMTVGGLVEQHCFNARLQTITIRQLSGTPSGSCGSGGTDVLRLDYGYDSVNNGNVASQTIHYGAGVPFAQTYTYDRRTGWRRWEKPDREPQYRKPTSTTLRGTAG